MRAIRLLALVFCGLAAYAATECACDPAVPATLEARQCSLCREAVKQTGGAEVFFLKDINPRKPNRWLALPVAHGAGMHHMHEMPKAARTALWKAAIAKSKELWGDSWGVAYNGERVRTQCHTHVHIGRIMPHIENDRYVVVHRADDIPLAAGEGVWIHGAGRAMHVHTGEQTTETALMR